MLASDQDKVNKLTGDVWYAMDLVRNRPPNQDYERVAKALAAVVAARPGYEREEALDELHYAGLALP